MKYNAVSPINKRQMHNLQIGPTPQIKGQLKSILDTASPSPLSKIHDKKVKRKLVFDSVEEEISENQNLSLQASHSNVDIFLSPIKLLETIDIKKTASLKTQLHIALAGEDSNDDETYNDNNSYGMLSIYSKPREKPKEKVIFEANENIDNTTEKEDILDVPDGASTLSQTQNNKNENEFEEIVEDERIENQALIGRPVQGYMKRKLMEMQPYAVQHLTSQSKEEFNEIYEELKKKKIALQEGTYTATGELKGTLTDDILPEIKKDQKKKKFNTVSNNFVRINLKRKYFKKQRK